MDWMHAVQRAIDTIEAHMSEELDAKVLAEQQYVSVYYFQKMFAALCRCTVGEYIRSRRLTLAGFEVTNTMRPILDIALSYGYDSAEGFTKAFLRFHGTTPSTARKNHENLKVFDRIDLLQHLTGGKVMLGELGQRGYIVREAGTVYYTDDMDRTAQWFGDILGWYSEIDARDEKGAGTYGCVNNIPIEIEALHIAPFTGVHLFRGEPIQRVVGFMMVEGIDKLYAYVKSRGWNQITEVTTQPWGSRACSVTTIDGSILTFFE